MSYQQLQTQHPSGIEYGRSLFGQSRLPQSNQTVNRGMFLLFLLVVTYCTVLASAVLGLALFLNILVVCLSGHIVSLLTTPTYIVQGFLVMYCGVCLYCEMEWTEIIRSLQMLQNWIIRGLFYVFVGLTAIQTSYVSRDSVAQVRTADLAFFKCYICAVEQNVDDALLTSSYIWPAKCLVLMGSIYLVMVRRELFRLRMEIILSVGIIVSKENKRRKDGDICAASGTK
jgi:hypothetical protein